MVNLSVCVYKDQTFAKAFGVGPPKVMPRTTLVLFAARNSFTVLASFNLPPLLAPTLGLNVAQLVTPCAMQFLSTPIHLYALDLFNRADQLVNSRIAFIQRRYLSSSFARVCRILPAFGIAGILNREVRATGMLTAHRSRHIEI